MANPVIINPTLTLAGQAAAFNASNNGVELKITHVSFGTAHYTPNGTEVALTAQVGNKVAVAGASRPTPYQIRMVSNWREDVGQVAIGEIAWWSGATLVFVWSKADGTVASYKTDGVAYVLFNDLAFSSVPANSISFLIDPNESVALAALAAHEGANNAHPQYILRAKFPDYQGHLWGEVTGTANTIALTLPAIVELTQYIKGNRFSFKATATNTGATTININDVGPVPVLKTGGVPLTAGSIVADGVYDVYYDGEKFQLTAGAGFASAEGTMAEVTKPAGTSSTSWVSVRLLLQALALKANTVRWTSSTVWVCPDGIFKGWVTGGGGGAGGGGGGGTANNGSGGGGGGGAGEPIIKQEVALVPGNSYTIVIGAGGSPGAGGAVGASGNAGLAGGQTKFGTLVTLAGGTPGAGGDSVGGSGGFGGFPGGTDGSDAKGSWLGGDGGAGGGGPFGTSGGGGRAAIGVGVTGAAGAGYGTGGAGGGAGYAPGGVGTATKTGGAGSAGKPGLLILEY